DVRAHHHPRGLGPRVSQDALLTPGAREGALPDTHTAGDHAGRPSSTGTGRSRATVDWIDGSGLSGGVAEEPNRRSRPGPRRGAREGALPDTATAGGHAGRPSSTGTGWSRSTVNWSDGSGISGALTKETNRRSRSGSSSVARHSST